MIVFFTVIVEGGVTILILEKLRIPMNQDYDSCMYLWYCFYLFSLDFANKANSNIQNRYLYLDMKYLKPFFTKNRYRPVDTSENIEMRNI